MGLFLRGARAAIRANPKQSEMAIRQAIPAATLQIPIELFHEFVLDLNACTALAADQVVMRVLRDLIDQGLLCVQGRLDDAIAGQELKGSIHRGLTETARTATDRKST